MEKNSRKSKQRNKYRKKIRSLKLKKKRKKGKKKRKIPQSCKSPTQRQRFITTIKNVTAGGAGGKRKSLIRFHSAKKIDNYNRGEKKKEKKKKIQKDLQNKYKHKSNKCFS